MLGDPRPERVLLISGGSGITPVMAMLRTLCDEGFAGEIGFLNYARSSELALYGAELDQLAERDERLRVARGFTRGRGLTLTGRFRREHLRAVISDHSERGDVRLRATGADRLGPRASGRRTAWPSRRSRPSRRPR